MKALHVSEVLAIAGVTDYTWATPEARLRGRDVHLAVHYASNAKLKHKSVPQKIAGYLEAFLKFSMEAHVLIAGSEINVSDPKLGLVGRLDARGYIRRAHALIDYKTGNVNEATGLQLCLYGHMLEPEHWFPRVGVELHSDGSYRMKVWERHRWAADLSTALAAVRLARWKIANGFVRDAEIGQAFLEAQARQR